MKRGNKGKAAALCLSLLLTAGCSREVPSPAGVTAQLSGEDTAVVTWDAVEGADGYRVFKKSGGNTNYQYVCDVEQNSWTDSGIAYGETCSYKIKTQINGRLSEGTESKAVTRAGVPAITEMRILEDTRLEVRWEDAGAQTYRLYGASDSGDWTLLAETERADCVLSGFSKYAQLALSAVYSAGQELRETPRSEPAAILGQSRVTAVTQMDRYTAAVQYEPVANAAFYQIYRCGSAGGNYDLIGASYDAVYYDEIEDGGSCFYKVQPVSDRMKGPLSAAVRLGANAKPVSGVAVFMYHDFVTQEDLDAGVAFDEYAVWADEFEQDLRWLRENGYTTVTASELVNFLDGRTQLPAKAVMLTIDDGKLGVYRHAYPLLKKYGMKAVLAVIGECIDEADANPQERAWDTAPYCTWSEIGEMSASGALEIVSHSYTRHRFENAGHTGANIADGEREDDFYQTALKDCSRMDQKLREVTGKGTAVFSYPYSKNSAASDRVWMRCGYKLLFCGDSNDVRHSQINYYVQSAGVNYYSARTRRLPRMTGTPLSAYMKNAIRNDDWIFS